jgi:hypothetical protein
MRIIITGKMALSGHTLPKKIQPHLSVLSYITSHGFCFFGFYKRKLLTHRGHQHHILPATWRTKSCYIKRHLKSQLNWRHGPVIKKTQEFLHFQFFKFNSHSAELVVTWTTHSHHGAKHSMKCREFHMRSRNPMLSWNLKVENFYQIVVFWFQHQTEFTETPVPSIMNSEESQNEITGNHLRNYIVS